MVVSNAEIQFTSLKTGLQNLQNRIQGASLGENAVPFEREGETARILARIGNIACLGRVHLIQFVTDMYTNG